MSIVLLAIGPLIGIVFCTLAGNWAAAWWATTAGLFAVMAASATAHARALEGLLDRTISLLEAQCADEHPSNPATERALGRSSGSDDTHQRTDGDGAVAGSDAVLDPNRARGLSDTTGPTP